MLDPSPVAGPLPVVIVELTPVRHLEDDVGVEVGGEEVHHEAVPGVPGEPVAVDVLAGAERHVPVFERPPHRAEAVEQDALGAGPAVVVADDEVEGVRARHPGRERGRDQRPRPLVRDLAPQERAAAREGREVVVVELAVAEAHDVLAVGRPEDEVRIEGFGPHRHLDVLAAPERDLVGVHELAGAHGEVARFEGALDALLPGGGSRRAERHDEHQGQESVHDRGLLLRERIGAGLA